MDSIHTLNDGQARELTIGDSFFQPDDDGSSLIGSCSRSTDFHTIRYDFKPASIDDQRMGQLSVSPTDGKSVTVQVPHLDQQTSTTYSGHVKSAGNKDCVLIIDHNTGKLTLERVRSQILLKKRRDEKLAVSSTLSDCSKLQTARGSYCYFWRSLQECKLNAQSDHTTAAPIASSKPAFSHQPSDVVGDGVHRVDEFADPSDEPYDSGQDGDELPQVQTKRRSRTAKLDTHLRPLSSEISSNVATRQDGSRSSSTSSSSSNMSSSSSSASASPQIATRVDRPQCRTDPPSSVHAVQKRSIESSNASSTAAAQHRPPMTASVEQPKSSASMPQFLTDDLQLSESDDTDCA